MTPNARTSSMPSATPRGTFVAQLGRRLENLRSIPRLHFELDESIAYSVRVSTLLRDLAGERPAEAVVEVPE